MNKVFILPVIMALVSIGSFGQEVQRLTVRSSVPATARYELVQPGHGGYSTPTYRLDKVTGEIYVLGQCAKGGRVGSGRCWRQMEVLELPRVPADGRIRYQIFMSTATRAIFLLHIDTGDTWQLGADGINDKWFPFLESVPMP